jgi:hypothetical protein
MAEISSYGYTKLREFAQTNWKYIELRDASSNAILRLTTSDPRVTWTHNAGAQAIELTIVVKGSDADLSGSLPRTFASSAIYDTASGGTVISIETFTQFTMSGSLDELTVKHQIQIPML